MTAIERRALYAFGALGVVALLAEWVALVVLVPRWVPL